MTTSSIIKSAKRLMILVVAWCCLSAPLAGLAADAELPTLPSNFQARVESEAAKVILSWNASADASGIKAYRIDRSLDESSWVTLSDTVAGLTYEDMSTGPGVHYFYRINAADTTGSVSAWTATDVTTPSRVQEVAPRAAATFTSDDGVASVEVPSGATTAEVACTLALVESSDEPLVTDRKMVAGPYALVCKMVSGDIVREFKEAVTWTFDLGGKSKLKNPVIYQFDGSGRASSMKDSVFDSAAKTVKAPAWGTETMSVLIEESKGVSPNLIVLFLFVVGAVIGVVALVLRKRKKITYDEYMRSKYYDL